MCASRVEARSLGVGFGCHFGGEFGAAEGVEARFEGGDAEESPFGVGNGLDEVFFVSRWRGRIFG